MSRTTTASCTRHSWFLESICRLQAATEYSTAPRRQATSLWGIHRMPLPVRTTFLLETSQLSRTRVVAWWGGLQLWSCSRTPAMCSRRRRPLSTRRTVLSSADTRTAFRARSGGRWLVVQATSSARVQRTRSLEASRTASRAQVGGTFVVAGLGTKLGRCRARVSETASRSRRAQSWGAPTTWYSRVKKRSMQVRSLAVRPGRSLGTSIGAPEICSRTNRFDGRRRLPILGCGSHLLLGHDALEGAVSKRRPGYQSARVPRALGDGLSISESLDPGRVDGRRSRRAEVQRQFPGAKSRSWAARTRRWPGRYPVRGAHS